MERSLKNLVRRAKYGLKKRCGEKLKGERVGMSGKKAGQKMWRRVGFQVKPKSGRRSLK